MEVKVQKVGNSLMVVIPKPLSKEFNIEPGDDVLFRPLGRKGKKLLGLETIKKRKKLSWKDVIGSISIPNFDFKKTEKSLAEEYGR